MLRRFDTIRERDRRTDGRTDGQSNSYNSFPKCYNDNRHRNIVTNTDNQNNSLAGRLSLLVGYHQFLKQNLKGYRYHPGLRSS